MPCKSSWHKLNAQRISVAWTEYTNKWKPGMRHRVQKKKKIQTSSMRHSCQKVQFTVKSLTDSTQNVVI